jgi:hypothetical protein
VSTSRRLFVLLCLAAILWAAMHPATSGLPWAMLAPFLFFVALIVSALSIGQPERLFLPASPSLRLRAPRAPPQV